VKIKHLGVLRCAVGGLISVIGSEVHAQESVSRGMVLDEVIVTAQKRSESLQTIPVAVTALTSDVRELIGITTLEDMTNFTPGLTYEGQLDRANIRGVGRVINAPGTDPGVALYTDGFYNSSTTAAGRSTIFNDRVEVLRGPQVLYGRNTTGGAINTISRSVRDNWGGELRATYGDYDRKVVEATVTGPIADWLKFRLSGAQIKQDEGYFKNINRTKTDEGGVQDDEDYELLVAMDLGESVDLQMRLNHREQFSLARFSVGFTQPAYVLSGAMAAPTATTFTGRLGFQPSSLFNGTGVAPATLYTVPNPASPNNRRVFDANIPPDRVLEGSDSLVTTLVWRMPFADLKWIGGYTDYQFHSFTDTDGIGTSIGREFYDYTPPTSPANALRIYTGSRLRFYEDKTYWSNEFNLTSNGDGPLSWIGGLYQYHERYAQIPIAQETSNPQQSQLRTVYAQPTAAARPAGTAAAQTAAYAAMTTVAYNNRNAATSSVTTEAEVNTYATFGQLDYQFSDKWKGTIGARLSRDEKEGVENRFAVVWDPSVVGALAKAYDNSAPLTCITDPNRPSSVNPAYQRTVDAATGQEIALAATATSYTSSCRKRTFEKRTWDDWSATTGLEFTPMEDVLTYAKFTRGYKSGAIRFGSFSLDAVTNPEYINAYELGAKSSFGSKLQLNAAAFYYDYSDYQFPVTEREDDGAGGSITRQTYTNLKKAESYGLELEAQWYPVDKLAIWTTYSFLKTKIQSDLYIVDANDLPGNFPDSNPDRIVITRSAVTGLPTTVAQNVKGNSLPSSPQQKVAVNANYTFDFVAGSLTPSLSYSWRDQMSSGGLSVSAFSRDRNSTPAYSTWDGRITWTDAQGRFSIIGAVANLMDDETVNAASASADGSQVFNLNPPRTWTLGFQYRMGSEVR